MNRTLLAATAASLFSFSTLAAADSLSGLYAGASAVIAETVDTAIDNSGDKATLGASDNLGSADLIIGYNFVLESGMFLGVEANYNLAGIDEFIGTSDDGGTDIDLVEDSSYGIRGKLGAAVAEHIAVYGIAGYQSTKWEFDFKNRSEDNTHAGISFGLGGVYAINDSLLLTAEALHTDYQDEEYFDADEDVGFDETQFSVGLAYRFNL